ncbi:hypothetical protein GMRT_12742 [Giardia muris]|uniref:Cyclin n=1 Tax=Giardia muris TaxID=5742 RepID=A0A4Z1SYK0_GIAMU|nr:hypothetical protein GMRT_12742 [Giardia muris]|eukprot:TNJ28578.1 hypothetical protein GMRT_12742 [Giardia muris]
MPTPPLSPMGGGYIFCIEEAEFQAVIIQYVRQLVPGRYVPRALADLLAELDLSSAAVSEVFVYACCILRRLARRKPKLLTATTVVPLFASAFITSYSMIFDSAISIAEWSENLGDEYSEGQMVKQQRQILRILRWEILVERPEFERMCQHLERIHQQLGFVPPLRPKRFNYAEYSHRVLTR